MNQIDKCTVIFWLFTFCFILIWERKKKLKCNYNEQILSIAFKFQIIISLHSSRNFSILVLIRFYHLCASLGKIFSYVESWLFYSSQVFVSFPKSTHIYELYIFMRLMIYQKIQSLFYYITICINIIYIYFYAVVCNSTSSLLNWTNLTAVDLKESPSK